MDYGAIAGVEISNYTLTVYRGGFSQILSDVLPNRIRYIKYDNTLYFVSNDIGDSFKGLIEDLCYGVYQTSYLVKLNVPVEHRYKLKRAKDFDKASQKTYLEQRLQFPTSVSLIDYEGVCIFLEFIIKNSNKEIVNSVQEISNRIKSALEEL